MRVLLSPARSLVMAAALACSFTTLRAQELPPEQLYQKVLPSVMTLKVENKSGERYVGAAFLALREGVAVTAWHVIFDAVKVTAKFPDGSVCEIPGYVDKNETKDIALIRVDVKDRPLATLATTAPPVGTRTYVIGSPKGYEFSISDGLLSQVQKVDGFNQYQVSCPFSPGNSGGPILNARGEVVGVAAWTRNGAQNVNFATPATEVFSLDPSLKVKSWKDQSPKKASVFSFDSKRSKSFERNSTQTASQLKKTFEKAAGKEITVVVINDGQQEKFTFTVPPDFVK